MASSPHGLVAGRRAIVTGASRGIGAGIAERLAYEGADVAIVARTVEAHDHLEGSLSATLQKLSGSGRITAAVAADLSDPASRATIISRAEEALGGPIDILVNNAAAAIYAPLSTYPAKRRQITFQVNVEAPLDLAQAVLPGMLERQEGWILNVSSATARLPERLADNESATIMAVYGASKAALNRLTVGLAAELIDSGIRVNTVEPRAAVLSEGAAALVGDRLDPSQIESMEQMVEAALYLCRCDPDVTGRVTVSLDLLDETGVTVRALNGGVLTAPVTSS